MNVCTKTNSLLKLKFIVFILNLTKANAARKKCVKK